MPILQVGRLKLRQMDFFGSQRQEGTRTGFKCTRLESPSKLLSRIIHLSHVCSVDDYSEDLASIHLQI
jgi:hypothetical protein